MKPFFIKRVIAYFVDMVFVALLAALLSTPFIKDTNKTEKQLNAIVESTQLYQNNKITYDKYSNIISDVVYDSVESTGPFVISYLFISIVYFGYFVYRNNGKTIGKKLMKLQIKGKNKLTLNQTIIRSLFANFSLLKGLSFFMFLILSKKTYIFVDKYISNLVYFYIFICTVLVLYRKDGAALHDLLTGVRVENIKEVE